MENLNKKERLLNEQYYGCLKLHYRDKWTWFYVPLIIVSSSFLINVLVAFLVSSGGGEKFYSGGVSSILVFVFVSGIITVAKTFPFAIGLSIRRIDFFVGTTVMGVIVSILFGVLLFLSAWVEYMTNYWGGRFNFFHFPYVNDGTALEQIAMYIILLAHSFILGFLISSFAKRFGGKGMLISSVIIMLVVTIAVYFIHHFKAWMNIFSWLFDQTAVQLAYWLVPFVLIYLLASYILLRRTTV